MTKRIVPLTIPVMVITRLLLHSNTNHVSYCHNANTNSLTHTPTHTNRFSSRNVYANSYGATIILEIPLNQGQKTTRNLCRLHR
jgi:hypothetical protein